MRSHEIRLKIDPALTNADFVGYKSTSKEFRFVQIALRSIVSRSLTPNSTVQHYLKSIAYHNHLRFDAARGRFYFIDKYRVVWQSNSDTSEFSSVWTMPDDSVSSMPGDDSFIYYPTIHFLESYFLVTNGRNTLYVLDTEWHLVHKFERLLNDNFRILDSKQNNDEINVLLVQINREITIESILIFMNLKKILGWEIIAKKTFYNTGSINYASLNPDCSAVYVVSNGKTSANFDGNSIRLVFGEWKQTENRIEIQLIVNRIFDKKLFDVSIQRDRICVKCKDVVIFSGDFSHEIDVVNAAWTVSLTNKSIEVQFSKQETNVSWKSLFKEPAKNFEIFEVNDFTAANPSSNVYFAGNVEECDLYDETELNFERFAISVPEPSHYCEIGRRQFLFNGVAKSFVLRHNVDAMVWQPIESDNDNFRIEHIGTLPAYGYVQASKTDRKFLDCPSDFSYSLIVESYRNVYFYSHRPDVWPHSNEKCEQKIFNLPEAGDEIFKPIGCVLCTFRFRKRL